MAFASPAFASLLVRCSAPRLPRCSVSGGMRPRSRQPTRSRFGIVFSQAVRLPAEFRFEGTEVQVHRDPHSGAVVCTPVRPSAREFLELRDALLQEPGFREERDAFFGGLNDTSPPEPVDFP